MDRMGIIGHQEGERSPYDVYNHAGLRPYYLTHEFTIHDAPFDDEVVIAIGGASSGRAHARTGDRYQDMKEMGIEPK